MTPDQPSQVMMPGNQPSPPPVFASNPQGQKPKQKSGTPTMIGSAMVPSPSNSGGKTLLGQ